MVTRKCAMFVAAVAMAACAAQTRAADPEQAARSVVEAHFAAVAKGDKAAIEKCWDMNTGKVRSVSIGGYGAGLTELPVAKAITAWIDKPDTQATGKILKLEILGEHLASARVEFSWKGQILDEQLLLTNTSGEWKLVAKFFEARKTATTKAQSSYVP